MDTNNFCNLACIMCPFSVKSKTNKPEIMPIELYKKIARELFPMIRYLYLSCGTEPLVTPDFAKYLGIAKQYKVPFVSFCTNGILMDEHVSRNVIKMGINEVIFSIDGATKETFEKIRRGAKFETVTKNMSTLARLKRESNKNLPSIRINCTMQTYNFNELEDIIRLAKKYDVDIVQFRHLVSGEGTKTKANSLFNIKEEYNRKIDDLIKLSRELDINISYPSKFELNEEEVKITEKEECAFPWFYLYIDHKGRAKPCPFQKEYVADFSRQSLKDYENSPKLEAIKKELINASDKSCVRYCKSQGGIVDINTESYFE
jgi:MoaA/NifB/PqqE/SkfB family radical SAM enzyme